MSYFYIVSYLYTYFAHILFCSPYFSYFCIFLSTDARSLTKYTESCKLGDVKKQYQVHKTSWDSERVQALRRHLGLTQREFADRLGTRQQTISEWETSMYRPRGASATLLSIIAEQAKFKYNFSPPKE